VGPVLLPPLPKVYPNQELLRLRIFLSGPSQFLASSPLSWGSNSEEHWVSDLGTKVGVWEWEPPPLQSSGTFELSLSAVEIRNILRVSVPRVQRFQ
jgi:hypothetical protein